jgi:ABC-type transport system substrate-binding protein
MGRQGIEPAATRSPGAQRYACAGTRCKARERPGPLDGLRASRYGRPIQLLTGEPRNRSHVNDPALDDLLVRQRRTADVKQRREVIHQIQRHLARQQYYIHAPSGNYIAVWDPALRNYGPNLGYDYGGRLIAAWLDR